MLFQNVAIRLSVMNIFVVSSPFQYMFATMIAKYLFPEEKNLAVYYEFQQNFGKVFKKISKFTNYELPVEDVSSFNRIKETKRLFISNRYNPIEIRLAIQAKKLNIDVCLFEDGLNMYLPHQFANSSMNDFDKSLRIRNFFKQLFGGFPSHFYHSDIRCYYSFLDELPVEVVKGNHITLNEYFIKEAVSESSTCLPDNSCVILSQWFVRENYIREIDYMNYLRDLVVNLKKKYSHVYYKPHPRDYLTFNYWVYHELQTSVLPEDFNDIPVELLLLKTKMDIYGFGSASLIYAKHFLNSNSYTLISDINEKFHTKKLGEWCKVSLKLLKDHSIEEYSFE